ncbi:uncharacterized protein PV09_04025 [Verruconis gallopava]|uniref:Trichothecene 3-O-acetyltransferase-like N-terminal domain-containing protein n=1 Tax=Verruconis gallopava TaxID=253628 RepID=A0A0D2AD34_9PEZI|nr:uncharacterized protein PV09_04025 [Verruconis gallopava]KIW04843.1 hypothetical protein PV09_04025 [Verruconis gallopava]
MSSCTQLDFPLDILAQQSRINTIYTQLVFFFVANTSDSDSLTQIISSLDAALSTLYQSFPWTSGNVIEENNRFVIRVSERKPRLIVNDLRTSTSFPDWNALAAAQFPFRWLDENIIAARKTLADATELKTGLPVFLVKVNITQGGLLVSFDSQHGSMDMTGQAELIRLFAKACRHEPYTPSELAIANKDRTNVVPLLNHLDIETELTERSDSGSSHVSPAPARESTLTWAYFIFSARSLSDLKSLAMQNVEKGGFVSTDDSLSAFIWMSLCRARACRFGHEAPYLSTLSRNVDVRRVFSQPSSYTGLLVTSTIHTKSLDELERSSLGSVALQLRAALAPEKLKRQLQVQASLMSRGAGDRYRSVITSDPRLDVRVSSWAKETCCILDFGSPLQHPDAVRTPRFAEGAREGLVYLLPRTKTGEIVVGICLREDDMETLIHDELWSSRSSYIG